MSKSKKTLIKGGHIFDSKTRNQFTSLRDALANETKCGCGINCNSGYVSLPNFNSESGDKDGFYGLYVSNGELVVDTIGNVKNTINDFCNGGGSTPPAPQALRLTFDSIENADLLVGDAGSVEDWNTFFDLPTYGNPFTSVEVVGDEVRLFGGSEITLRLSIFELTILISIDDSIGCIVNANGYSFANNPNLISLSLPALVNTGYDSFCYACLSLVSVNLPSLVTAGGSSFEQCYSLTIIDLPSLTTMGTYGLYDCTSLTTIDLPLCTDLGGTVGNDNVFDNIIGNTITATFNSVLATNNAGSPDGDIQYLEANNTVTITYV
jgi:hypothetical protein